MKILQFQNQYPACTTGTVAGNSDINVMQMKLQFQTKKRTCQNYTSKNTLNQTRLRYFNLKKPNECQTILSNPSNIKTEIFIVPHKHPSQLPITFILFEKVAQELSLNMYKITLLIMIIININNDNNYN